MLWKERDRIMRVSRLLQAVARKWWLVVVLAFIFGTLSFYLNIYMYKTVYSASMTLYAMNRDKISAGQALNVSDIYLSQELLTQYSGIFNSRTVASDAAKILNQYSVTPDQLLSMVTINNNKDSNLLTITAVSNDQQLAVAAANAMGTSFTAHIQRITNNNYVGVLDEAQNSYPIGNNGVKKTVVWILIGAIFALAIIYVIEYFDTTIRSTEDIEDELDMRVFGIIPEHEIN